MFGVGTPEIVVIGVVLVAIVGPSQMPRIAEGMGKSLKIFRRTAKELKEPLEEIDAEIRSATDDAKAINRIGEKR